MTAEGFELSFGVNFLGTVAFTLQLRESGVLNNDTNIIMVREFSQISIGFMCGNIT